VKYLARKFNSGRQGEQLLNKEFHELFMTLKYLNYNYKDVSDDALLQEKQTEIPTHALRIKSKEDINYIDVDFRWANQTVDKGGYDYHMYSEEECEDFAEYIEEEFLDDKVDYKKDYYVIRVEFENSNLSIAIKTNEVDRIREIMAEMKIIDQDYYYRTEKEIYETVTEEITEPTVFVEPAVVNDEVFEIVE
jgi:hypothetical protein